VWRIIILGPADLERSIAESGLKQADLKVAVVRSRDEALLILKGLDADALLVLGNVIGRDKESLDLNKEVYPVAKKAGIAVLRVGGDETTPDEVLQLQRPLKFPAAAAEITRCIRSFYATQLGPDNELDADGLRLALLRCEKLALTGVMHLTSGHLHGGIHFDNGGLTQVEFGVLSGAEAITNMLKVPGVSLSFDADEVPDAGPSRRVSELLREADAIELHIGQLLSEGPQGPLRVTPDRLLQRMGILSDQIAWVLRLLDGKRDLAGVRLIGGVRAVEGVLSLLEDGIITTVGGVSAAPTELPEEEAEPSAQTASEPPLPDGDWIEEDFAWSIALGEVPEGVGSPSSFDPEGDEVRWDEGSDAFKSVEWDPLPAFAEDAALADAEAMFDAGQSGPLLAGDLAEPLDDSVHIEPSIEPMLGAGQEDVEPAGSLPPIAEGEIFEHGFAGSEESVELEAVRGMSVEEPEFAASAEPPPVSDSSRGFDSKQYTQSRQSRHFGSGAGTGTGTDYRNGGENQELVRPKGQGLPPAIRLILFAVVMGLTMAYVVYKRQSRIASVGLPTVQQRVRAAPVLDPIPGKKAKDTELKEVSKTRRSRRRRRNRRRKKSRRARLRTGIFAKRMSVARALRDDGDVDGAIGAYTEAFKSKVSSGEKAIALAERGEAYLSNGEVKAARADLQTAISLDARNAFALKTLGFIEYQAFKSNAEGARARALKLLSDYLAVTPDQDPGVNRWMRELR
jgi:hypothetical protein